MDICLLGCLLLDKKKSETLPLKADFPFFDTAATFSLQLSGFEACPIAINRFSGRVQIFVVRWVGAYIIHVRSCPLHACPGCFVRCAVDRSRRQEPCMTIMMHGVCLPCFGRCVPARVPITLRWIL